MAKVNQKQVKELLDEYADTRRQIVELQQQKDSSLEPARVKFNKAVEKADKEFLPLLSPLSEQLVALENQIKAEVQKGYDAAKASFATTKIETEAAIVEVTSTQQREISVEEWLKQVPKSEQSGTFFSTIKVLVGAADKFRSDIVNKIASIKRSHQISIRLK